MTLSYPQRSRASVAFREAVGEFLRTGRPNEHLVFDRHAPPVKVDRTLTKLLAEHPELEIERVEIEGASGCEYYRGELRVFVDGGETPDPGDRPLAIEIDPGKHALRVEESKSKPFTWEGTFKDGEKKSVPVKLVPIPKAPPPAPVQPPPEKSSSIFASGWFWVATGVVLAGAATGAYFYDRSKQLEPESGTVVRP